MAELVTSAASKLYEMLCDEAIIKVCEGWAYKTELRELQETVSQVKAVFLDANAKWDHLSHSDKEFIRRLRDVVYDADDVFDEFLTLAQQDKLDGTLKKRGYIFEKVCRFFSSKNQVNEAYRMSCQVKDIKKRLDAIANDRANFNLGVDLGPISRRPKETCSYVEVNDVIGRDNDKRNIVNMLLAPNVSENTPYILTIVGVGGLGKTALAQLVFSDERIEQEFPDKTSRLWVCVSDQDGEQFDDTLILCKILELVTRQKLDYTSKEYVVRKFEENIRGKKFLLVLDDVWNEKHEKWLGLKNFLRMGHSGSKIIVTTRSHIAATIIESDHIYELDGLSSEYSQCLFEMSAFGTQKLENHEEFFEIGMNIVEKCCRIPLALKVVGSLLYGQDINKWRSIQNSELAKIGDGDDGIICVLKLSYDNLVPSLKSCFSYCAVFPKDFRIEKENIIGLWMAQGYIDSLDGCQNQEDAADEHFKILLRRCFFQDVEIDEYGDVMSFKIHDLMHDVALKVGEEELCIVTSETYKMKDKIRHVYVGRESPVLFICNQKMRSYIYSFRPFIDAQINNCIHLRVLVLSECYLKSLPDSIGNVLHLRYLDLSDNPSLEVLCESITKLYNLQTLILSECSRLRELPKETGKLVNLTHLNLNFCHMLKELPEGISKLVNLKHLNLNGCIELRELPKETGKLINLRHLYLKSFGKLRELPIEIGKLVNLWHLNLNSCSELRELPKEIGKLVNLRHLNLDSCSALRELPKETSKLVNLRHLNIECCNKLTNMPLGMDKLSNLRVLPKFVMGYKSVTDEEQSGEIGMLKDLKALNKIQGKLCIEIGKHYTHVEDITDDTRGYLKNMECLRELQIYFERGYKDRNIEAILEKLEPPPNLNKLDLREYKGKSIRWWERVEDNWAISPPLLVHIEIWGCTKLEQLPVLSKLPHLKSLSLDRLKNMEYMENGTSDDTEASTITQFFPSLESLYIFRLPKLKGWCKVEKFNLYFPCLSNLQIFGCPNLISNMICPTLETLKLDSNSESLQMTHGVLHDDVIKLRTWTVSQVGHVKSIPINCKDNLIEEIEKASQCSSSFLQQLEITGLNYDDDSQELGICEDGGGDDDDDDDDDDEPWKSFHNSLCELSFGNLPKMKRLPKGMQHLASLQSLCLEYCENINEVPEWISCLSSLQSLYVLECPNIKTLPESFIHLTSLKDLCIEGCRDLKERCRKPDGEDFPKIQHIPYVCINGGFINSRIE